MMRKHRPTIFYGVPSLYTALLAHPEICKGAGSDRLRICVSAGEALPAQSASAWRDVVGVDVLDGLGSTELLNTFLSNRPARFATAQPASRCQVTMSALSTSTAATSASTRSAS